MSNIPDGAAEPDPATSTARGPDPVAPAPVLSPQARRAAFAAGRPTMPIRYIYWTVGILLLVIVGAVVADTVVSTSGTSAPVYPHHATPPAKKLPSFLQPTSAGTTTLHAPLAAFLGLRTGHDSPAPGFTLTDAASHQPVSLSSLKGHVVVLSFADARCDDICPVLGAELAKAQSLLTTAPGPGSTTGTAPASAPVTFVTVNTDPLDLHDPTILRDPGFASVQGWRFLTGTIDRLNAVWSSYGMTVTISRSTNRVSHNERVFLISPKGQLVWAVTPFANEDRTGTYTLPAKEIDRFARGVARLAHALAGRA